MRKLLLIFFLVFFIQGCGPKTYSEYEYDDNGEVIFENIFNEDGKLLTTISYNDQGLRYSIIKVDYDDDGKKENMLTEIYYEERLVKSIFYVLEDGLNYKSSVIRYYDEDGNQLSREETTFEFNSDGRTSSALFNYYNNHDELIKTKELTYNEDGTVTTRILFESEDTND